MARDKSGRMIRALPKGHPDISGILYPGRCLFIEAKSATGRLSPEQLAFQAMAKKFGALHVVARSLEDVEQALLNACAEPIRVVSSGHRQT